MVPIPLGAAREDIASRLKLLMGTIEEHELWTPPSPHPGLFQLWDFVNKSHYIVTELENICEGREVQHPDQLPPNDGANDNTERARMAFTDVLTRTITINKIVNHPTMMNIPGQPAIDFGNDIKLKSQAVQDAILNLPDEDYM